MWNVDGSLALWHLCSVQEMESVLCLLEFWWKTLSRILMDWLIWYCRLNVITIVNNEREEKERKFYECNCLCRWQVEMWLLGDDNLIQIRSIMTSKLLESWRNCRFAAELSRFRPRARTLIGTLGAGSRTSEVIGYDPSQSHNIFPTNEKLPPTTNIPLSSSFVGQGATFSKWRRNAFNKIIGLALLLCWRRTNG